VPPGARGFPASGIKPKDLCGIPWRVAFALQSDGWYLRQDIIWSKPNPMPESVRDRCTKAHEYIFMLSKSERYYYDQDAIKEPAIYFDIAGMDESGFKNAAEFDGKHGEAAKNGEQRRDKQRGHGRRHAGFNDRWDAMEKSEQCGAMRNKRSVWTVATKPYAEAHFATFPPKLIEPCILAGCPVGGTVLDPFFGSGTTGQVAQALGRDWIGIELNPAYEKLGLDRTAQHALAL
jgi:DNA modification methylase